MPIKRLDELACGALPVCSAHLSGGVLPVTSPQGLARCRYRGENTSSTQIGALPFGNRESPSSINVFSAVLPGALRGSAELEAPLAGALGAQRVQGIDPPMRSTRTSGQFPFPTATSP